MVKGKSILAAGMASFFLTVAAAADAPGAAPDDFSDNPALPSTADLVLFADDVPAAAQAAAPDATGAIQGAFPVYYGARPAAVTPVDIDRIRQTPPQQPQETTVTAAASMRPPESRSGSDIVPDNGSETVAAAPSAPAGGQAAPDQTPEPARRDPESDPAGDTHLAMARTDTADSDSVPEPGPAARQTPAENSGPAPEVKTEQALDGTPLPPPPLPELRAVPVQTAPPVDIAVVRADFNRLKAFCDEDNLGSAADVYAKMPDFGQDEEANRLRADAANLLILGLSRGDNLSAARRIYESVPLVPSGYDASLAKARSIINLATYYVRAERYTDAYDILMDIGKIQNRSALAGELFRLMARMIPYLDNADQTDKATAVFDLLLGEVNSPGTAALFAENMPGVFKYYLHYVDKSEAPRNRRMRLDFLEHAFAAMEEQADNPDIAMARKTLGESLAARYAGDPERAARFYVE